MHRGGLHLVGEGLHVLGEAGLDNVVGCAPRVQTEGLRFAEQTRNGVQDLQIGRDGGGIERKGHGIPYSTVNAAASSGLAAKRAEALRRRVGEIGLWVAGQAVSGRQKNRCAGSTLSGSN